MLYNTLNFWYTHLHTCVSKEYYNHSALRNGKKVTILCHLNLKKEITIN